MASRDSRTQRLTANLAFHTFAACLGGFSAGLNLGNLNTPGSLISECNKVPADQWPTPGDKRAYLPCWDQDTDGTPIKSIWGMVCSILAVGGFVGALLSTQLATRLGRKYAIMAINLLFVLGGLLMALSNGPVLFGIGRFFSGVATGAATSLVSMYVNEISTGKIRGALGACLQLNVVIGIMVASLIGQPLSEPEINKYSGLGWRIIVSVVLIPAVLQVVLMFVCVETPSYLISKGRLVEAKTALQKLRGKQWNVDYEYADILKSQGYANDAAEVPSSMKYDLEMKSHPKDDVSGPSSESTQLSFAQVLKHPKMRKMLLIAIGIHLCQQITGINSIITYSTQIFRKAYPNIAETLSSVVMLANLLATFPSLVLVEKLGRKSLLLYGLMGMTAGTSMVFLSMVLDVSLLVIIGVLTYIVFFAVGLGPIPFLIIPELFPTKGVAVAAGLANFVNYFSNFLVVLTFPMYETPLGNYVFVPFLVLSALGAFFVFTCVPETKGKTLAELGYTEDD